MTLLKQANEAFRKKEFQSARDLYKQVIQGNPDFAPLISANLRLAEKHIGSSTLGGRPKVLVCCWNLSQNAAGRAVNLAQLYSYQADVGIIGTLFKEWGAAEIWPPIRDLPLKITSITIEAHGRFLAQAFEMVAQNPCDLLHISKPRFPNLLIGILYKAIWNAMVLVDIDDEELAFVSATEPISLEEFIKINPSLPDSSNLLDVNWTRLAVSLAGAFDGVTVVNSALQKHYGGEIIRHTRCSKAFLPSPQRKSAARAALNLGVLDKVIMFLGTPRAHKGLLETAKAIAASGKKDALFLVVGDFPPEAQQLKADIESIPGLRCRFIGDQSFDRIPEILAAADLCVLLQDSTNLAAKFQTPAKLTDALAMGIPVLAEKTPALEDLAGEGAFQVVDRQNLASALENALQQMPAAPTPHPAFHRFLTEESHRPVVKKLLEQAKTVRRKLSPDLKKLCSYLTASPTFAELKKLEGPKNKPQSLHKRSDAPIPVLTNLDFIKDVSRIIESCELVTFDIWDTVLRRDCDPDEIKLRTARMLWLMSGIDKTNNDQKTHINLFWLRKEAERNVADEHYEYRIADVFHEWLRLHGIHTTPLVGNMIKHLIDCELGAEISSTTPDESIRILLNGLKGKRALAISDFYHSSENLKSILKFHGLAGHFDKIYASCDWMKTKRAGHLYDLVLNEERTNRSRIVHIGDNPEADYQKAQEKGMQAFLYDNANERLKNIQLRKTFEDYINNKLTSHIAKIIKIIDLEKNVKENGDLSVVDDMQTAGRLLSPLAVGFVLQCLQVAIRRKCENIYFVAREGIFFKKIYDELVSLDVFDIGDYPKPEILYASRRATFAASLTELSLNEMMRIWNLYSTQSIHAMARSLNLDTRKVAGIALRYGMDTNAPIQYPWLNESFKSFFNSPDFQDYAKSSITHQKQGLLRHLHCIGFEPEISLDRVVVDIGWRGTIQDNICHLVKGHVHGAYLALKKYLNHQPQNSSKQAFISNDNTENHFNLGDVAALEFIFNVPGGSVIGYDADGEPLREVFSGEESAICNQIAPLQQGIIEGTRLLGSYIRRHGLIAEDLIPLSRHLVSCYISNPPICIADAFQKLEHNETFGTGEVDCISQPFEIEALTELGSASLHSQLTQIRSRQRWPESLYNTSQFKTLFGSFRPDQTLNIPCYGNESNVFSIIRSESRRDTISIFTPMPLAGSGGHRTIYNFAKGLAKMGFDVHVMLEDVNNDLWYTEQELAGHDIKLHKKWIAGIRPRVAVATIAHSAKYVREYFNDTIGAYFVQDYEAEFNPLSDGYVRGQNSYAQGLAPICIGHWLPNLLRKQFGIGAAYGGLGVDTKVYYPIDGVEKKDMVAFLYQPEKWRRMTETCIAALAVVKKHRPQTEIVLYGSNAQPNLPFEATQRGLVHDLSELNKIYNEATVGLCLSLTNPSRIPIEYMAAGCIPVDLYRYNNLFDNPNGASLLAYQSESSIAGAILHLLEHPSESLRRRENGIRLAQKRTMQWEVDSAVNAVSWLCNGKSFDKIDPPEIIYTENPFIDRTDDTMPVRSFCIHQKSLAHAS